ncbi:KTSC domain-containing protein [Salinisphaera sp. S4-8]|uniref:KTSC domain-containing protein n=1 Tax=Salinisphaera sp. S4-8 TaxID=633357 RepID=UPI00333F4005
MEMIAVSSSAIRAVGYDPTTQRMNIRFQQGHTYSFCRVPASVFEGLLAASSKGSYYDRHIRDRYQC